MAQHATCATGPKAPVTTLHAPGYEILGELGRGGMGVVYKARQVNLNRLVALKMLRDATHADVEDLARLRAEAETVARLQHPNIVHIYDIGETDGCTFLALEYIDGGTLSQKSAGRPWSPQEAAQLVATLARAVHAAHERGIIHRDLKPANVLLMGDGAPKIADFGLAKRQDSASLTQTGIVMGSPSYMAPEQAEGKSNEIGPATDVYALGAILYELLTGRPPFQGDSALAVVHQVANSEPIAPSRLQAQVPRELEAICLRCLRKNPRHRYASARDLADFLSRFLDAKTVKILPSGPRSYGGIRFAKSWLVVAAAAIAIVGVTLLLWANVSYPSQENDGKEAPVPPAERKPNTSVPNPEKPEPAREPRWEILPAVAANVGEKFASIAFPTRQIGYAASNRAVYKTEDAGQTWKAVFQPAFLKTGQLRFLRFSDERTGWLGCNNRLYATQNGGESWTPVDLNLRVYDLALGGPSGGALVAGAFEPDGFTEALCQQRGTSGVWDDLKIAKKVAAEARTGKLTLVARADPNTIWIAFVDYFPPRSTLSRSTDGGKTWKMVFKSDGSRLSGLHFSDAQHGWLTGSSSLWFTEDGGDTWKAQLNPEDRSVRSLSFDPRGSFIGIALTDTDGRFLLTTTGTEWRSAELGLKKSSLVSAAVVDAGCAFILSEDGRIGRHLDPESGP
ncbi:MAG: protein kinase [Planctomycetes bacterium]|nr:protein kinase [Planctomycetota bacterium]